MAMGSSLVDRLRHHPELQSLPLLVYSARDLSDAERAQLQLGPTTFLTKARVQAQEVESLVLAMLRTASQNVHTSGYSVPAMPPFTVSNSYDTPHTHHR